jgi:DNA-binding CsgD family transcriptional regulator
MIYEIKQGDMSDELQVYRTANGIILIRPNQKKSGCPETPIIPTGYTIGNLLKHPVSFYLLDKMGHTVKINEEGAFICGFESAQQSIGKSLHVVSTVESAVQLVNNCTTVMRSHKTSLFEEENSRKDGVIHQFLSVKIPWYDQYNHIIGTCGFSMLIGKHSLADSLSLISRMGLLEREKPAEIETAYIRGVYLSKRETECLRLTIKGCTAKKIARIINISYRTVEEYLTNIKIKVGASSKSELIEIAMGYL